MTSLIKLLSVFFIFCWKSLLSLSLYKFWLHFKFDSLDIHLQNPSLRHAKNLLRIKRQWKLKAFTEELYTRSLDQNKTQTRIPNSCCAASRRGYLYLNKHSWQPAQYMLYNIFTEGCQMIPASPREAARERSDICRQGKPSHWYFEDMQEVSVICLCRGRGAMQSSATASVANAGSM